MVPVPFLVMVPVPLMFPVPDQNLSQSLVLVPSYFWSRLWFVPNLVTISVPAVVPVKIKIGGSVPLCPLVWYWTYSQNTRLSIYIKSTTLSTKLKKKKVKNNPKFSRLRQAFIRHMSLTNNDILIIGDTDNTCVWIDGIVWNIYETICLQLEHSNIEHQRRLEWI